MGAPGPCVKMETKNLPNFEVWPQEVLHSAHWLLGLVA